MLYFYSIIYIEGNLCKLCVPKRKLIGEGSELSENIGQLKTINI